MSTQAQTQTLDPYTSLFNYIDKVITKVKPELEKMFQNYDIWYRWGEEGNELRYEIIVEAEVTELLGLERECIWFEGVYESCQDGVSQNISEYPECNEDSPSYNEARCRKIIEECVNEHLENFKNEYCGLPFRFAYNNPPMFLAYLEVLEEEDNYSYCCGVKLVFKYMNSVFKDVVQELAESKNAVEANANQLLWELKKVVEALKALA